MLTWWSCVRGTGLRWLLLGPRRSQSARQGRGAGGSVLTSTVVLYPRWGSLATAPTPLLRSPHNDWHVLPGGSPESSLPDGLWREMCGSAGPSPTLEMGRAAHTGFLPSATLGSARGCSSVPRITPATCPPLRGSVRMLLRLPELVLSSSLCR